MLIISISGGYIKKVIALTLFLFLPFGFALADEKPGKAYTDPAQSVEISVGQEFRIVLESNHTTGYMWQLAAPLKKGIITLVGSEYKRPELRLAGAGGTEVWTFKAEGKGKTEIFMKYARPWEKDATPAKRATFKVIVNQSGQR